MSNQVLDRAGVRLLTGAAALACLAGMAWAEAPAVLDFVPADAPVVISIRNVGELLDDVDAANRLLGDKAMPEAGFVTMMGRGMPGIDLSGSAAVVMTSFDPAAETPAGEDDVIVLVPVSDFAAFTQQSEGVDGVHQFSLGEAPAFARRVGDGYAAVAPVEATLRSFAGVGGHMGSHAGRLGGSGLAIADGADITVVANVEPFRAQMLNGLQEAQQQALFFAAMGAQGQDVAGPINGMMELVRGYVNDAKTAVVGLSYDAGGMTFDFGTQFTEGSASAEALEGRGDAGSMLGRLPGGDYYFAYAMDLRSPALASLAAKAQEMSAAAQGGASQIPGQMQLTDIMKHATGAAGVIGASPAMMTAGFFSNAVTYVRTDDAEGYTKVFADSITASNGQAAQGVSFATSYTPDAKSVAGVPVDSYGVKMSIDPAAAGQMGMGPAGPQQMVQMMFGPSMGPNGHVATLDSGVVQTMSPSQPRLERAIGAAREGNGLGASENVRQITERLPEGSMAMALVSYDQLANTLGPLAMMFGAVEAFEPVPAMDPVAMGVGTDGGGMHFRLFVPGPIIASVAKMAPAQQDPFAEDDWGDDATDEDEDIDF